MPDTQLMAQQRITFTWPVITAFVGFVAMIVVFWQGQKDRDAAAVQAMTQLQGQVAALAQSVAELKPQVQAFVTAPAAIARLEASTGPISGQVRELERGLIEQRASVAGHQKDIDALRLDVSGVRADVVRRGEATTNAFNQLREWFFRPPARNQRDDMPLPDRMDDRSARARTTDATVDVDWQSLKTRDELRAFLLAYALGSEPQWRTTARIINQCWPTAQLAWRE